MDSNVSTTALEEALAPMEALTAVLADDHAGLALVRADGTWHLEQNGAVRRQSATLPQKASRHLIDAIHRQGPTRCLGTWWVRPMTAGPEGVVVFIRRPEASPQGLSSHTLKLLTNHLPDGANGLVFGAAQMARSSLLLSMTNFLPKDLVIYVGPVPPLVPDEVSLLHVLPPRHDRDRRELALLFERASAVLFDGPIQTADLRLLFTGPRVANRWLAVAADDVQHWRDSFALPPTLDAPVSTHIGVRSSPLQKMRIDHFSVLRNGHWQTLLEGDDLGAHSATSAEATVAEDPRMSAQLTSPIHVSPGDISSEAGLVPPSSEAELVDDDFDSSITNRLEPDEDFDVSELLDDIEEPEELLRESGEIDVPGFISRRQMAIEELAERSESQTADGPLSEELRGERIDRELPELVASGDIDDVDFPDIEPEQLRQTFNAEVDVEALKEEKKKRTINPGQPENRFDRRSTSPNIPSRRIDRSTGLSAESSATMTTSADRSGQWTRQPASSGRVIPIPSSSNKRTEAPTAELGQIRRSSGRSRSDAETPDQSEIETHELATPEKRADDGDLDVREVLDNLRQKRASQDDGAGDQ